MVASEKMRGYYTFPSPLPVSSDGVPSLAEVGGKALSLIESSAADFPVPPGLCLTVSFFETWTEQIYKTSEWKDFVDAAATPDGATKGHCDAVKEKCQKKLKLDTVQKAQLEEAIKSAFGENATYDDVGIVAVRSSSPEEDLTGSSFAGGYDTTLGVTSATLQDAIVESFASMFDFRIVQYKLQHGMPVDSPRIAIILQRQIASDVSGVGFSINPNNNCYDEVMISANFGLGESVVGGIITPDTYVVDTFDKPKILSKKIAEKSSAIWLESGGGTREEKNKEPTAQALTDEQILEVANLVARVEEHRGGGNPVDIEWAYHDGNLYLLQARPVTAYIPLFSELLTGKGEEKRLYLDVICMSQGFSDPLSVLGLDIWRTILASIKPSMSAEGEDGVMWNIHGREYFNISNMIKMTGGKKMLDAGVRSYEKDIDRAFNSIDLKEYEPSEVPAGVKGMLWKQLAQMWEMLPTMIHGLFYGNDSMTAYIQGTEAMIERCHDDKCSTDELFGDSLESLIDEFVGVMPGMGGIIAFLISRWRVHRMLARCEGADDLLISLCMDMAGNPTSEMGHMMVKLAAYLEIQNTPNSKDFLQKLKDGSFSDDFMSAYTEYIKRFGMRGMREIDVATPRTYEDEGCLFDTLKQIDIENNQINNVSERRNAAYEKLLTISKEIGKEKQFKHHAHIIQSLGGFREHPKYMLVVIVDRMRRHALNIATEFVSQGRLQRVDEIFALNIAQITEAQRNVDMKLLPVIEANMEPYKKVEHVKNWPKLIDSRGKIIRGVRQDADAEEGTLLGDPISPGVAKGKAKVLNSPYEKPLHSGEILVAKFTEPSWTPIFINCAAVAMEIGGPMQHGAIIAREYGIPCVSGIEKVTTLLKDGDLVEVDGSTGTVKILESDDGVIV